VNEQKKGPGEAEGDGHAVHGDRTEVTWDGGKGRQPYTNQEAELPPAAAGEYEAGNAGDIAGRNLEQLQQVKERERPASPGRETPQGS
jgi:hypothetical protein